MLPFSLETHNLLLQQTAQWLLQGAPPEGSLGAVARTIQSISEATLTEHQFNPEAIACRAGCGHCCIVNVAVLDPEADAIADHLRHKKTRSEQQRLSERADEMYHQICGLDDEERIMQRRPCLFLDQNGCCEIYPVRPLLCRALTSTDPERCRLAIAMMALGESVQIVSNTFQQELFTTAFTTFGAALEQAGKEHRSQSLTGAIRERLANPA